MPIDVWNFNSDESWTWNDAGTPESYGDATGHLRSNYSRVDLLTFTNSERTNVMRSYTLGANRDFVLNFDFLFVSSATSLPAYIMIGLSDTDFTTTGDPYTAGNGCFSVIGRGTSFSNVGLVSIKAGVATEGSQNNTCSFGVNYYGRLSRAGTTLTSTIYSDAGRTVSVASYAITNCCVAAATILYAALAIPNVSSRNSSLWIDNISLSYLEYDIFINSLSDGFMIGGYPAYGIDINSTSDSGVLQGIGIPILINTTSDMDYLFGGFQFFPIDINSASGLGITYGRLLELQLALNSTTVANVLTNRLYNALLSSLSDMRLDTGRVIVVLVNSISNSLIDTLRNYFSTITLSSSSECRIDTCRLYIIAGNSTTGMALDTTLLQTVLSWLGCYVLNLDTKRTYQFDNYDFQGIGKFNDVLVGIKTDAIRDLQTAAAHDDTATDISAYMGLGKLDFGIPTIKGIRRMYVEGSGATARVTFTKSDTSTVSVNMTLGQFRSLPKTLIDEYISVRIENVEGEQITITRIEGNLNILNRKEG